jgi:Ca2+-binding RTX toxin-like protein
MSDFELVPGLTSIRQSSFLIPSASGRYVFVLENNISSGPMHLYDAATGQIVASRGIDGFNTGHADISEAAGLVVNSIFNNIVVLDLNLDLVRDLSSLTGFGRIVGVHFSDTGDHLFLWDEETDDILVYDTVSWTQVATLNVVSDVDFAFNGAPWGLMDVGADGRFLFLDTVDGFEIIDLATRLSITLTGTSGADILNGAVGIDSLSGGDGDDLLHGAQGADTLDGGAGLDIVSYEHSNAGVIVQLTGQTASGGDADGDTLAGFESARGSAHDDTLVGTGDANVLNGAGGNDSLEGSGGDDILVDGGGDDVLNGGAGFDTADYSSAPSGVSVTINGASQQTGGAGLDTLTGMEALTGSAFADTLVGSVGGDRLEGGAGDDIVRGLAGSDTLIGGAGLDVVDYTGSTSAVAVNIAAQTASGGHATGDALSGIEGAIGTALNDSLLGDPNANALTGAAGDDLLAGLAGADALNGGAGVDTIDYALSSAGVSVNLTTGVGSGGDAQGDAVSGVERIIGSGLNDSLIGESSANLLTGGAGDDVLRGLAGADTLEGGAGADTVDYTGSTAAVTVNLTSQTASGGDANGDVLSSFERAIGSALNDSLTGDGAANSLAGGDGDDLLVGLGGADALNGGAGLDTIDYASSVAGVSVDLTLQIASGGDAGGDTLLGIENAIGSAFIDALVGSGGANVLAGGAGDDAITGLGGADALSGGAGVDVVDYSLSTAGVTVNLTAQTASGGHATGDVLSSFERAVGSAHNDILTGDAGANALTGGAGDDVLAGLAGADSMLGGAGFDTVDYATSSTAVVVNLTAQTASGGDATGDVLADFERAIGSALNDTLTGGAGANILSGGAGDDVLVGLAGADSLIGGSGADTIDYAASGAAVIINLTTLFAGGGDAAGDTLSDIENVLGSAFQDTLTGSSAMNVLTGGASDDSIAGLAGADALAGGAGIDLVDYGASDAGVAINLTALTATGGHASGDALSDFENIGGSTFNDSLTGDAGANSLFGGGGDDVLTGLAGGDSLIGGAGFDTVDYSASGAGVTINLATQTGGGGHATGDTFLDIERAIGTNFNDFLTGDFLANTLTGAAGDDVLQGADGNDVLNGGAGNDILTAGAGNDALTGGSGVDTSIYSVDSTSASWVRHLDGSWTVAAGAGGPDTMTGVEFLDFADRDVFLDRAARTFSGDGGSDILWRNANGVTAIWGMNGATVLGAGATGLQVGLVWSIGDTGDFNGDGRDDILWRNANGQTVIWQMNNSGVELAGSTSVQVGNDWAIQGVGDFNLDGRDDIVWRNASGLTVIWQMNGASVAQGAAASVQVDNAWQIAGIGDFDGDGRDDFVWRHDNGLTAIWHMNGAAVASSGLTTLSAGTSWEIAGVGDFNGDGRDDLLWRNDTGLTTIWHMNGTSAQGASASLQVGNEWAIAAVGDYNGDGRDDILWRHDNGLTVLWEMQGGTVIDANTTSIQVGNDWGIV